MNFDEVCRAYTAQGVELAKAKEQLTLAVQVAEKLKKEAEAAKAEALAAKNEAANLNILLTHMKELQEAREETPLEK